MRSVIRSQLEWSSRENIPISVIRFHGKCRAAARFRAVECNIDCGRDDGTYICLLNAMRILRNDILDNLHIDAVVTFAFASGIAYSLPEMEEK